MQSARRSTISPSLSLSLTARRNVHNAHPSTGHARRPLTASASLTRTWQTPRLRNSILAKAAHVRPAYFEFSTPTPSTRAAATATAGISTGRSGMPTHKEILATLPDNFDKARESGDLLFFPSSVHTHAENGIEFQIRLCPALQNKPRLPTPDFTKDRPSAEEREKKRHDPFAPPYVPALYLGEVRDELEGREYVILFNKYSVVPHHFMMVTKDFQSQTSPLLPTDLVQVYLFLLAAKAVGRKFFAFYNCGDLSGASQPHKHVQLIPIDDDGPPVEKLARATKLDQEDRPFSLTALPYANHVRRLPSSLPNTTDPETLERALADAFLSLLDLAIQTVRHDPTYPAGTPSYNVFLTLEHMHVVPRRQETHTLAGTGEKLSVNALGFAGMLLVKSERELEAVKEEGVAKILKGVALESVHEAQTEAHRFADDHVQGQE